MGLELAIEGAGGGTFRTNPARDIAHFWPQIVAEMANGLLARNWEPWYRPWCEANRVHEGHLLRAHAAFLAAMDMARWPELRTPFLALEAAGFTREPWPAQLVVVAKLGQLGTGAFWAGIRSAHHVNEPSSTLQILSDYARKTQDDLAQRWGGAA